LTPVFVALLIIIATIGTIFLWIRLVHGLAIIIATAAQGVLKRAELTRMRLTRLVR